jgi:RNA polymerase sigma-70 factor (ECF subfamily)
VQAVDFDTVYREQKGRVLGAIRSVIGPSEEIEDVVQLTFIEIFRCLGRFEGRSKLSTWVYRIAVNVALQHIRRKQRRRWMILGTTGDETMRATSGYSEAGRLEDREALKRIYQAVNRLSEKKRVVWTLHEMEGLTPHQIADVLDIPSNTVRSRLLAARRDLMETLSKLFPADMEVA